MKFKGKFSPFLRYLLALILSIAGYWLLSLGVDNDNGIVIIFTLLILSLIAIPNKFVKILVSFLFALFWLIMPWFWFYGIIFFLFGILSLLSVCPKKA